MACEDQPPPPKFNFCWVEGDTLPPIVADQDDLGDMTGFTITLHLQRPDGTTLIIAATPIDLTQGQYQFDWSVGDLQAGYDQLAEIQTIDLAANPLTSELFTIDVRPQLA